ncbi:aspartyl-phosphate phosphatase Spo0E family protein [Thermotalea metallivorans]|uniref:Spo0E like sporulation regulatory protein n=1 Tax=Thermotalea metallivorans TaxID=520762 RepID=A0A140L2H1_9FIRM|nr:aspartyl-phosphate phosphatase Spo0E family protein [Thermotalea metallivorans]KXG74746.1 hypothetical protein AN619_20860 [Thermotalea metallivorans]
MSNNELKKKIEALHTQLEMLIKGNNYNLLACSILECSQELDELIAAYMRVN